MKIMSRRSNSRHRRDTFRIARTAVLPMPSFRPSLRHYEDRRVYHPLGRSRPAQVFSSPSSARPVVRHQPWRSPSRLVFSRPQDVVVCVRRQRRKQVLHALNKTGKVGQNSPRWTGLSSISCRS